tara:strand:+ start:1688 stop:1882 length:195 start_codon:yes stop_codon:yes gene_type:complete
MKLPEKNDTFLLPTMSLVGSILLISHILGYISPWWALVYVPLLFMGHAQEYKTLFYSKSGEVKK